MGRRVQSTSHHGLMSLRSGSGSGVDLNFASVYWTHEELYGSRMTEAGIVDLLHPLAVDDCVERLSRLSCLVESGGPGDLQRQRRIINRMGFTPEFVSELEARVDPELRPPRILFFPQQITHLMRLVLRHCDRRPRDRFDTKEKSQAFMRALFGVTDLFHTELRGHGIDAQIEYMLRQQGLLTRPDPMMVFSRYYDLLLRLWPQVLQDSKFDPNAVFQTATGLSIEHYFTIGFGVYSRFLEYTASDTEPATFSLHPESYFAKTQLRDEEWQRFLSLVTATPDELSTALDEEDDQYGPTLYRSYTFDRKPLVRLSEGQVMPTSFGSLQRAVTEGVFWTLANATETEGVSRETFTSPFGKVFERFTQESIQRIAAKEPEPPKVYPDFHYGPKSNRALSSDVNVIYPGDAFFCEVVTGRPNVPTITRGDLRSFWRDVDRLIAGKAKQLSRCLRDFFYFGSLKFDGVGSERLKIVWPVLIMVEEFPLMPPIRIEIDKYLRSKSNWPTGVPRLTVMDADELGALEALVEQGWTFGDVVRRWKREEPELPLANWLEIRQGHSAGHSTWHEQTYRRLTELVARMIFGRELPDIEKERGETFGVPRTEPTPEPDLE